MKPTAAVASKDKNTNTQIHKRLNTNTRIHKYSSTFTGETNSCQRYFLYDYKVNPDTVISILWLCQCVILAGMAFNTKVSDDSAEPAESLKFLRITAAVRGRKSLQQRAGETVVRWFPASRRSHLQQFPGISVAGWRTQEGLSGSHPFTRANLTHHLPSLPCRKLHRISSK